MAFNFEKERLVSELRKRKPKKVLIQLAEGIKQNASEIVREIENLGLGTEVIVSGETCWGGCSVAVQEAQALGADLIVHFGHAKFMEVDFPVLYIEVKDELNLKPLLKESLKTLEKFKIIGLSYSIQHKQDIDEIKKFYEEHGKTVFLSKKLGHVAHEGHVVGCQYLGLRAIQKQVECFVIIGNQFHSMGACLAVKKPVVLIDVYNNNVRDMEGLREKILKQRVFSIEKFKKAKKIGIIIETKLGQKFGSPEYLVEKLKEHGKEPIIITMNEITPDKIMNFYNIDAFVELACPRIATDDFAKYPKPILTFKESLIALGEISWEEILEQGIL
jgi:2-(3-amino-3-carboxypropyl)histidine synthase